eukprot:scaffold1117_cov379-Prasinococcus_capsulatus_cf.AAC.9
MAAPRPRASSWPGGLVAKSAIRRRPHTGPGDDGLEDRACVAGGSGRPQRKHAAAAARPAAATGSRRGLRAAHGQGLGVMGPEHLQVQSDGADQPRTRALPLPAPHGGAPPRP